MNQNAKNHILVVDDEPFVLEAVALLLDSFGYDVSACGHPREALNKLQSHKVDIVLTDIKMPEMSGIELLEEIRKFNTEVPVILMTAYAELNMAIEAKISVRELIASDMSARLPEITPAMSLMANRKIFPASPMSVALKAILDL